MADLRNKLYEKKPQTNDQNNPSVVQGCWLSKAPAGSWGLLPHGSLGHLPAENKPVLALPVKSHPSISDIDLTMYTPASLWARIQQKPDEAGKKQAVNLAFSDIVSILYDIAAWSDLSLWKLFSLFKSEMETWFAF